MLDELRTLKALLLDVVHEQRRFAETQEDLQQSVEALREEVSQLTLEGPSRSPSPVDEDAVRQPPPFDLKSKKFYVIICGRCPGIYTHLYVF